MSDRASHRSYRSLRFDDSVDVDWALGVAALIFVLRNVEYPEHSRYGGIAVGPQQSA